MRWISYIKIPVSTLAVFFLFLAGTVLQNCQSVPPDVYDNPLDTLATPPDGEDPLETPALVFFPLETTASVGYRDTVKIFALDVFDLAGTYIEVNYDHDKVELISVTEGDFFQTGLGSVFFFNDDNTTGTLEIYSSFLGGDTVAVLGTGCLAELLFKFNSPGQSALTFSTASYFVDPDNYPIDILGYGEGVINAQ